MDKKISVALLGATGAVGQKFVELLANHPWFDLKILAASTKSAGKRYGEAVTWMMPTALPEHIAEKIVHPCDFTPETGMIVFSALESSIAGPIELAFAQAGCYVISNSSAHRMHPSVPLLVPEINSEHLALMQSQSFGQGAIITNPNCTTTAITLALKPLVDLFGVEEMQAVTLQALSGAGYPGVASLDILDNVLPFIPGEEEKIETEPLKILGKLKESSLVSYPIKISAQCNRVGVSDGHTACLSIKLREKASKADILKAWNHFEGLPQKLHLPSAPARPLVYLEAENHPQPKLHRSLGRGMSVALGRLRPCRLLDWKFTLLSHNTIRGAAGSAILNAELMWHQLLSSKK